MKPCMEDFVTAEATKKGKREPGLPSGSQLPEEAMPAMHELMKDIPDEDEGSIEKSTEQRLQRVHRNLGHPPNRLLVHILKEAKAPESVIDVAKKLECPICARCVRTSPARPANHIELLVS